MAKQQRAGKVLSLVISGKETEYVKACEKALGAVPQEYRGSAQDVARAAENGETIRDQIILSMVGAIGYWNKGPKEYRAFFHAVHMLCPTEYVQDSWKKWCKQAATLHGIVDWKKPQSAEALRKAAERAAKAPKEEAPAEAPTQAPDEWTEFLSWANSSAEHKTRALAWFRATVAAEQAAPTVATVRAKQKAA